MRTCRHLVEVGACHLEEGRTDAGCVHVDRGDSPHAPAGRRLQSA
jgi:hypothetical protein